MKLQIVRVPRRPGWPLWAVLVVLAWGAMVFATHCLMEKTGNHASTCMFKRITGYPCATCGATRGIVTFLDGDIVGGWLFNPLLFTILAVIVAELILRLAAGKAIRLVLSKWEKRGVWIILAVAFAVNWAYIIRYVG
ncbi:MAG: DUF2752 domain-containing protein [Phycisphaerae bacterium]|nr:DUF2752 domain-containing protein [Phycisphaerae bacterium]